MIIIYTNDCEELIILTATVVIILVIFLPEPGCVLGQFVIIGLHEELLFDVQSVVVASHNIIHQISCISNGPRLVGIHVNWVI